MPIERFDKEGKMFIADKKLLVREMEDSLIVPNQQSIFVELPKSRLQEISDQIRTEMEKDGEKYGETFAFEVVDI